MTTRILTPQQMEMHANAVLTRDLLKHWGCVCTPDGKANLDHYRKVARLAAFHSNRDHNPTTGRNEWLPDTPTWIIEMAQAEGWV